MNSILEHQQDTGQLRYVPARSRLTGVKSSWHIDAMDRILRARPKGCLIEFHKDGGETLYTMPVDMLAHVRALMKCRRPGVGCGELIDLIPEELSRHIEVSKQPPRPKRPFKPSYVHEDEWIENKHAGFMESRLGPRRGLVDAIEDIDRTREDVGQDKRVASAVKQLWDEQQAGSNGN